MNVAYYRSWFYLTRQNVLVCVPPKCGSTALAKFVLGHSNINRAIASGHRPMRPDEAAKFASKMGVRALLATREPTDRFASMWRCWCRSEVMPNMTPPILEPRKGMSPDELMDAVEACPMGNPHWYPQIGYVIPSAELVPYDEMFEAIGVRRQTAAVTRARDDDPPMPVERIRELYAADFALHQRALEHRRVP